jgi:hypothetical protein
VRGSTAVDAAGGIKGIALANGRALVANAAQGLKVYELGATPQSAGRVMNDFAASRIAAATDRTVVTGAHLPTNTARLRVVDTTDPTQPRVVGELPTTVTAAGILDVAVNGAGTVAVTAMGAAGIWVVDLSDPAAPVRRGVFDTAGTAFAVAVDPSAALAYVADGSGGLKVVSFANPAAPTQVGNVVISGIMRDVVVQGGIAYLADQSGRLVTVDVATPSAPRQLGAVAMGRFTFNVAVRGGRAVVHTADSAAYLDVVDVTSPASPTILGSVAVDAAGTIKGLATDGERAYVANAAQGLRIYALGTGGTPSVVGIGYTVGDATDVVLVGDAAYVADSVAHVDVVDLLAR